MASSIEMVAQCMYRQHEPDHCWNCTTITRTFGTSVPTYVMPIETTCPQCDIDRAGRPAAPEYA